MMDEFLRKDDLEINGLFIWQDKREFCFGIDAVLLSYFADIKRGDSVLDLCTGNGIVPILLTAKKEAAEIFGIEINAHAVSLAERSARENNLTNVHIIEGDIKEAVSLLNGKRFHHVTVNPPYMRDGGLQNPNRAKAIARHEILCSLDDVVKSAASVLHFGGKFTMVHRPDRLADVIVAMRHHKIEPKRLQMVHPKMGDKAVLFLIEGTLGGGAFMHAMEPLYIYREDGQYTEDVLRYYGKDEI